MSPPERRRQLHGWVTAEALDGWQRFAEHHGTNVTSLMEAVGQELRRFADQPSRELPEALLDLVRRSQQVAGARSSRARKSTAD